MSHNQKVVLDTIRLILDDDSNTELSPLHQVNIHLVADAMKWAIRYSEETLVTYEDYQTFYLDQGKTVTPNKSMARMRNKLCAILEHVAQGPS